MSARVLAQGVELVSASLRDSSDRVQQVAQRVLLPAFAMWAAELKRLETDLVTRFVRSLEELVKVSEAGATRGCSSN